MSHYRLYFLNPATGGIERFEAFDAEDDEEAVRSAQRAFGWQPVELWSGARRVWHSEHRRPADPVGGRSR